MSELGLKIVRQDQPAIQAEARREAVMAVKSYSEILTSSAGTSLPSHASLAAKFEFTYGLGTSDAQDAARDFIASVRLAEFLAEGDVVQLSLQEAAKPAQTGADTASAGAELRAEPEPERKLHVSHGTVEHSEVDVPSKRDITLSVSVDLSHFPVEDVLRILGALGLVESDTTLS